MNGDFTRLSFRPKKHYSGVLMQQGRVQVDADWNELVQIIQHRIELQAIDTIGACGVPRPPSGQPAPFTVTAQSDGSLHLEPGRIYVDGLLCELEPDAVQDWPIVSLGGEDRSSVTVTVLVYLDAWQRHVSAIEDSSLRESALGGPDTATRLQTAWALRINFKPTPSRNCDSATDLPTPSTGTLTTHQAASSTTTPCIVGTKGGYTGLENRLYRVEIHQSNVGGQPAAFKWSRDNNSMGLSVSGYQANDNRISVTRLGRDDVTRFLHHWVEVIGDQSESLYGAGTLAQVLAIDQVAGTLKLDRDVSSHQAEANLRIRRWDMPFTAPITGFSPPAGAIAITPGATIVALDPSVAVSFDVATGATAPNFKVGDFWTFTARTAEGMVEPLTNAPPQGIQHHYCKLAWVTWNVRGEEARVSVVPCSHTFPPLTDLPTANPGTCISLAPGPDLGKRLQAAVDSLRPLGGGCICLPPGIQVLEKPIKVDVPRTTICGCNGTSRLVFLPAPGVKDPAITITGADRTILKDFGLFALGASALISIQDSGEVLVENCRLVNLPAGESFSPCVMTNDMIPGLTIRASDLVGGCGLLSLSDAGTQAQAVDGMSRIRVERCRIRARLVGAYVEVATDFLFDRNDVAGFSADDWTTMIPSSPPGLAQSSVPILEKLIDDRLHAGWAGGPRPGYLLPLGLGMIFPTTCTISRSQLRAGIGILAVGARAINISDNQIFGLVGSCLVFSYEGQMVGNQINTALYGCLATGWFTNDWQVEQNLITSRDGIVIGPASTAGNLIVACLNAIASGLAAFKTGRDALRLKNQPFEPGPTTWPGAKQLSDQLLGRFADYMSNWEDLSGTDLPAIGTAEAIIIAGNLIRATELGVSVERSVYLTGGLAITGNDIGEPYIGWCNLAGIRLHATSFDPQRNLPQIQGNRLRVTGIGISVESSGTTVSDNWIEGSGRASRPSDLQPLELIPSILNLWTIDLTEPWGVSNGSTVRILLDAVVTALENGSTLLTNQVKQLKDNVLVPFRDRIQTAGWPDEGGLIGECIAALAKTPPDFATAASRLSVAADLFVSGIDNVGIRLAGEDVSSTHNTIRGLTSALPRGGILIDPPPMPDRIEVRDNRIFSGLGHGVEIRTTSLDLRVTGNTVEQFAGNGISFIGYSQQARNLEVSDNRIIGCRYLSQAAFPAIEAAGILVYGVFDARLLNNVVEMCGDPKYPSPVFGIAVLDSVSITASGNRVVGNGGSQSGSDRDRAAGAGIYLVRCNGTLVLDRNRIANNQSRAVQIDSADPSLGAVLVQDNVISGTNPGAFRSYVRIIRPNMDVTLTGNHIDYSSTTASAAVVIQARRSIIANNVWLVQNKAEPVYFFGAAHIEIGNITPHYWFFPLELPTISIGHNVYG